MPSITAKCLTAMLLISILGGCKNYAFTLNEQEIYTPPVLFTQYRIPDTPLSDCVTQTIKDKQVYSAAALQQLACTNAGLISLQGLETFRELQTLVLDNNKLDDAKVFLSFPRLTNLQLKSNQFVDVAVLADLSHLENLSLLGNEKLDCNSTRELASLLGSALQLPEHCQGL